MTTDLDDTVVSELDNVIDGALALPAMAKFWRVPPTALGDKRLALIFAFLNKVEEEDGDPELLKAVAARAIDRLEGAFAACRCHDDEDENK